MEKIKVGFIGTGMMGREHIKVVFEQFKDVAEVSAICDTNSDELNLAKKLLPENVKCFSDYRDIINEKDVQAVFISLPNYLHCEVSIAAMKGGKDVFCEKPIATKIEDVYRMIEVKEKTGRILMIGLELRYSEYFQKMKKLVDLEVIGNPVIAWCKEFRGPFLPKIDNWIIKKEMSGGALVDKNSHHFDLMTWFLNAKPIKVCAFGGKNVLKVLNTEDEIEDNAVVIVEYENGKRASLSMCMFSPATAGDYTLEIGLIGDKGRMQTEGDGKAIHIWKREKHEDIRWVGRSPNYIRRSEHIVYNVPVLEEKWGHWGFLQEHTAFFDAIRTRRIPLTGIENVIYSTIIPIAAEESIKTGRVIDIK